MNDGCNSTETSRLTFELFQVTTWVGNNKRNWRDSIHDEKLKTWWYLIERTGEKRKTKHTGEKSNNCNNKRNWRDSIPNRKMLNHYFFLQNLVAIEISSIKVSKCLRFQGSKVNSPERTRSKILFPRGFLERHQNIFE